MANQNPKQSSPNRWRTDQIGDLNQPMNYSSQPASGRRIATVSIPDLRAQDIASLTSFDSGSAQPPVRSSKPESIRSAMEKMPSNVKAAAVNVATVNTATKPATQRASDLQSVATRLRPSTNTGVNPSAKSSVNPSVNSSVKTNSYLNDFETPDPQLRPLIESILDHYPPGGSAIIMLAGTERNPLLDVTVASIAVAIQNRTEAKILIIDSDFDSGSLTGKLDCSGQFGLADLTTGNQHDWKKGLRSTCRPQIDFLPIGTGRIETASQGNALLKTNLSNICAGYGYVFVNAGDAHGIAATSWSQHVSGTYLLVSQTRANQTIAKSAVSQLTTFGARLIGCIVSDVG